MRTLLLLTLGAAGGGAAAYFPLADRMRDAEPRGVQRADQTDATREPASDAGGALRSTQALGPGDRGVRTEPNADAGARAGAVWADIDPAAFLAHASGASSIDDLVEGLEILLASDPESVFEIASRFDPPRNSPAGALRADAVRALVERDPQSALARLEPMPQGFDRDALLRAAGDAYARLDPDAAIAWVRSLDPPVRVAEQGVIAAIAEKDFDRAYTLDATLDEPVFGPSAAAVDGATRDPRNMEAVASDLIGRSDQRAPQLLSSLLSTWVVRDTNGALDWMSANQASLDTAFARSIAGRLAGADIDAAKRQVDRLPPQWQDAWIAQVAGAYAERDVEAAVDWISEFRARAGYEQAFAEVVMRGGQSNPSLTARYVEDLSPSLQGTAAANVAGAWLREDPAAAAQWASTLSDPEVAATAIATLTHFWLQVEPGAAERWVLDSPPGRVRDEALRVLMGRSDLGRYDPTRFLDEFSSDERRQEAVRYAVDMLSARGGLASGNAGLAEALLRALIDDPALGDWARERLEAAEGE